MEKIEQFVQVKDVAEYLQVSPKTLYHWTHLGRVPHYRLPKGIRFRMSEIEGWMQRRRKRLRETVVIV